MRSQQITAIPENLRHGTYTVTYPDQCLPRRKEGHFLQLQRSSLSFLFCVEAQNWKRRLRKGPFLQLQRSSLSFPFCGEAQNWKRRLKPPKWETLQVAHTRRRWLVVVELRWRSLLLFLSRTKSLQISKGASKLTTFTMSFSGGSQI